jgi:hypothetical protein
MDDRELDKIIDFVIKYSPHKDREKIKDYVLQHFQYKTAFVGFDDLGEITFVCRWNIEGRIANILDLYIREDWRGKNLIKQLLWKGLWLFPYVRFIKFERQKKYPNRKPRLYAVVEILKKEKVNV